MATRSIAVDDVAPNPRQIARIEEGSADADRGDFASDEEMARIRDKFARRPAAGQAGSLRTG